MHIDVLSAFLVTAGILSGMVNSVAGGGSVFLYPFLLLLGIPPVAANASTSVVVWPGTATSAWGYRAFVKTIPRYYFLLIIPCLFGGLVGAILLSHTQDSQFEFIVPWFMALATVLLALQGRLHRWLQRRKVRAFEKRHVIGVSLVAIVVSFTLAIYGGYFGGGFAILLLACLGLTSLKNLGQMNGLKNIITIAMDSVAIAYFITIGLVDWTYIPLLAVGSAVGGWMGATYGSKLPAKMIRRVIVILGVVVTLVMFIRVYT